ncbi:hypothetical protein [Mucilaginibacter sp.]|uniref:hypothetical protein n=1 Tax=Mucilaginibacter sp. TaxID=1882438 RepID=UPI00283C4D4D|nr:hypothetical protein [Mucilaginibacter sp.]MDR3694211.1 hypothetical protein [Mucilaginibacter sp.]
MEIEEIKLQGSDVFLECDEKYNTQTSFNITEWTDDSFVLEIFITNQTENESNNKLILDIDYIIEILKKSKRLGGLIDYQPNFKKITSTENFFWFFEISFFFVFEK